MTDETGRLLDLWMPPENAGAPIGCLATTFTFEPDFFEEQCISRFLGLQSKLGEGDGFDDLAALIEREEQLAEIPVVVVADRGLDPDSRSLRWDLLAAHCRTGVMHAKVSLLHWERLIRIIVSSANLTERAHRSSLEVALALDFERDYEVPSGIGLDLLAALDGIVRLTPADLDPEGPRARASGVVDRARDAINRLELPVKTRQGAPRLAVVVPDRKRDGLAGLMSVWHGGGPPTRARIMSPFFDKGAGTSRPVERLTEILTQRGATVEFVVPVDQLDDETYVRFPTSIDAALPSRISREIRDVRQPDPDEPRSLHGKVIELERPDWIATLVGSANFTTPGLWTASGGNVEVCIAIGVRGDTRESKALRGLILAGERVPEQALFEAQTDPEEGQARLPLGFIQAVLDPGPPATLKVELVHDRLTVERWSLEHPNGQKLLSSSEWTAQGSPRVVVLELSDEQLPQRIVLRWRTDGLKTSASMPVNVLDPSRLPPPAELRALPVSALIRALASMRPLSEAIAKEMRRHHAARQAGKLTELDPHKRFSPSGQLLHRTRELSKALDAHRERLSRPFVTEDAFRWRVHGPFGPVALAQRLVEERAADALPGELPFILAETALTLRSVDLGRAASMHRKLRPAADACIAEAIDALSAMHDDIADGAPPGLAEYVAVAFAGARS